MTWESEDTSVYEASPCVCLSAFVFLGCCFFTPTPGPTWQVFDQPAPAGIDGSRRRLKFPSSLDIQHGEDLNLKGSGLCLRALAWAGEHARLVSYPLFNLLFHCRFPDARLPGSNADRLWTMMPVDIRERVGGVQ